MGSIRTAESYEEIESMLPPGVEAVKRLLDDEKVVLANKIKETKALTKTTEVLLL